MGDCNRKHIFRTTHNSDFELQMIEFRIDLQSVIVDIITNISGSRTVMLTCMDAHSPFQFEVDRDRFVELFRHFEGEEYWDFLRLVEDEEESCLLEMDLFNGFQFRRTSQNNIQLVDANLHISIEVDSYLCEAACLLSGSIEILLSDAALTER